MFDYYVDRPKHPMADTMQAAARAADDPTVALADRVALATEVIRLYREINQEKCTTGEP